MKSKSLTELIDSGVLPESWERKRLDEVAFINQNTSNLKEFSWINYTDISSVGTRTVEMPSKIEAGEAPSRARRSLKKGDTVISTVRPNRKSFFYFAGEWENAIASTGFAIVSPMNLGDSEYLQAILTSDLAVRFYENICEGAAYPAFNPSRLAELVVPWPSKQTRTELGNIVMNLQLKIELNNAQSKTLEDIAQTIFKSWFIDFDPVKAKMAGEKPVGMDAATAALFHDSMDESEIGLIPKDWRVKKFGEVNNLLMGQSPPGDTYNSDGEGLPFYQGRTDFGFRFPKQRIFCTQENRVALSGETLISVRAPVGDVNQAIEKCIIGRGVASALHKSNSGAYTFSLLKSLYPRLAYFNGEGTVFGAINRSDFNNMLIVEPPASLVESFEAICGPMNAKIRSLFLSSEALIQLRDSLLPRLISGELQIPEELLVS